MGRRTCKKNIVELIAKLRMRIPDIAIRTTLIAGFPGETEADHEALMEFVNESEYRDNDRPFLPLRSYRSARL